MNKSVISPCKGTVRRYGKKMTPNTDVFLLTKSMFIIVRSGTSPMQIGGLYIHVISYPDKPLNFIIFLQGKGKDLNFFGNFDPINFPPVLFVEFFQERPAFNPEHHRFLDFPSFGILEAGNNFVEPYVDTTSDYAILHLSSLRLHA